MVFAKFLFYYDEFPDLDMRYFTTIGVKIIKDGVRDFKGIKLKRCSIHVDKRHLVQEVLDYFKKLEEKNKIFELRQL